MITKLLRNRFKSVIVGNNEGYHYHTIIIILSLKTRMSEASEEWILTSQYGESPIAVLFYGTGIWPSPSMPHKADMESHLLG
ncbi:hypothetical protein M0804_001989 [Polistes exclamans]|nr:hypothetical protein M0804_001989 [Polistes exclamans]